MKRNTMINTIIAATTLCIGFLIGYGFKNNIKVIDASQISKSKLEKI